MITLRVGTANIRGYPPMRQRMVRADLVKLRRRELDILATQEMWKWRYRFGLRRVFGGYRHATGRNRSTALSMNGATLELVRKYAFFLHRGYRDERLDERWATVMVTRVRAENVTVATICVHPGPKRVAEDHRDLWPTANENVLKVVREQLRLGRLVIVAGDTNQHGDIYGQMVDGCRVLYGTDADCIDKLVAFVPKGLDAEWLGDGATELEGFTDHTMYVRRLSVRRL